MKRYFTRFTAITVAMALVIGLLMLQNSAALAESWSFEDGDGTNGMNYDTTKSAANPSLVDFNGTQYAVWSESIGSTSQIRVKKYSNGSWVTADNDTPLNKDAAKDAIAPSLVVYNNELYASWQEVSSWWQLRVAKFNGTSWNRVDGDGTSGINPANTNARNPKLIVFSSSLYVIYDETGGNGINQVRVRKYDGGSSWSSADGGASLNKNATKAGQSAVTAVNGSKLYVAWGEGSDTGTQIRVKSFDGTNWSFVDGNGVYGLNIDTTKWASGPFMEVYNNGLYLAWSEPSSNNHNQIRVKKYDGSTWTEIDGGDATKGLNQNTSTDAYQVRMRAFDGNLYAIWQEGFLTAQIRVKKYDGSTWVSADGSKGLNKSSSNGASSSYLAAFDSSLYATFLENNGTNQVRVVKMGPSNTAPTASGVSFKGTLKAGNTLTGEYAYADTENDSEGTTTFKWYTATDATGTGKTIINGAASKTFTLTGSEVGKYILFEVTPTAATGTLAGTPVVYTSASAVLANDAPTASSVSFTGTLKVNSTLTGTYTYADPENDAESGTTFKWYTADDATGTNKTEIAGANSTTLTLKSAQYGKYIIFEATPAAASGTSPGLPVGSSAQGKVDVTKGDVNGDGHVTPADALYITRSIAGSITLTDEQMVILDMNNDGKINADDTKMIMNIYLGVAQG